jgi:hypothetical protein
MTNEIPLLDLSGLPPAVIENLIENHAGERVGIIGGIIFPEGVDADDFLLPHELSLLERNNASGTWYRVPNSIDEPPPVNEPNPFDRATFNLSAQGELFKRDPAKYSQLKAAANATQSR